jgi:hypothetical protein
VSLVGTLADREKILLGTARAIQLILDFRGHQEDVCVTHHDGLDAVIVASGIRLGVHPLETVFSEKPLADAGGLDGVVLVPLVVHAGDVATLVVLAILEVHGGKRAGITATGNAVGDGGTLRGDGEGEVPTTAAGAERNHVQRLEGGTGGEVVHIVHLAPIGFDVLLQGGAAGSDGGFQIIQGLRIEGGLLEFGIAGRRTVPRSPVPTAPSSGRIA